MNDTLSTIKKEKVLWEENISTEPEKNCLTSSAVEQNDTTSGIKNDSTKILCGGIGKISGIYKIINKVNGKYYVGSSNDIVERWRDHRRELHDGVHVNNHLQKSWKKYGRGAFKIIVVERVIPIRQLLLDSEQRYLDVAKTCQDECYNMNFEASGADPNNYIREKLRAKTLELWKNPLYAAKVSKALKGIPSHRKGKHLPEQTIQKIKNSRLRGTDNPRFGIPRSEETKRKIRETKRKRREETESIV